MDLKEQDLLGADGASHWYYLSKGRPLRALLAGRTVPELLDVGAGSGVFARQLLDAGVCSGAVCVDPNYREERTERRAGGEILFRRAVARVSQPLILMIDVLEHVADDCGLLRSYAERAAAGTLVLISVPAFRCLWSGHDVFTLSASDPPRGGRAHRVQIGADGARFDTGGLGQMCRPGSLRTVSRKNSGGQPPRLFCPTERQQRRRRGTARLVEDPPTEGSDLPALLVLRRIR